MRPYLPLNALRAFESSARHLSFTRAAFELNVTQAAVSQQVRTLEERLGTALFKRLPRGLAMTDEGLALRPVLTDAFDRIEAVLKQFEGGHFHEVLTVGVVGTFAVGWLMPRLKSFRDAHPFVELRLLTNNNLVERPCLPLRRPARRSHAPGKAHARRARWSVRYRRSAKARRRS